MRAQTATIYFDNFAADPLGSVPVATLIGQPWVRSTAVMPFSSADQAVMTSNANITLSFQYHALASNGSTPYLDISGLDTLTGDPAFLYRIMSQPTAPSSGLHEVYYLNPASGLTDTGLAVPANSLQLLTVSANFASDTSQFSVGGNTATLPLYMCPSMIQEASLSSYMIGSGGISYSDIDNITATTSSPAAGPVTPTPEPGALALLLAAAGGAAVWWLRRRRKSRRGSLEERTNV